MKRWRPSSNTERMKHVARRHFFIRECAENHQIRVRASSFLVRTDDNVNEADFLRFSRTGAPPGRKFFPLRSIIMNVEDRD